MLHEDNYFGGFMKSFLFVLILLVLPIMAFAQDEFFEPQSSIGGYGEMHYNVNQTSNSQVLDFHRFVLFYGYEWTPEWSFIAEVEIEHNFVKSGQGELELEQATIDFHPSSVFGVRAGVLLAPVGIINLTHEPPTFLSVERPEYSKVIVPTTWFGNGASVYGAVNNFQYNFTLMEGLDGDELSASSGLRGGRQKGYKADAHHWMGAARVDYTGISGVAVGLSYTTNQANRTDGPAIGIGLVELHAQVDKHNIVGVFEYGQVSYENYNIESSTGYYFDIGYNVGALFGCDTKIIPWFRWSDLNTASTTISGGNSESMYHNQKWMVGLTVKPIDQVVFKIDFGQNTAQLDNSETKLLNIGAGYMF
jgi:hypothetical protein